MAYDQSGWHSDGDFPEDLPAENGGTHIGMFLAWSLLHDLAGELHLDDGPGALEALRSRTCTCGEFLFDHCDGKFYEDDLSEVGNAFAEAYYAGQYADDYNDTLAAELPTIYHVEDTWENFDKLAPVLDRRFEEWKNGGPTAAAPKRPWWKFWE